jgi:hypothetical protein
LIQDVEPLIEALIERIDSFEVVDREITDWHVFSDVQKWSELEEAADYFYRKGTISGYKDGLLKPEELINRAEAAKIFVLATGVTEFEKGFYFKDVPLDSWFQPYASTAKSKKIIWGYNDGNFRPNQPISRVEFLSMASNAFPDLKYYKEDARQFEYDDLVEDEWYNEYAGIGINLGLFEKNENLFKPHKAVTRGEFILNLYRAINGQP